MKIMAIDYGDARTGFAISDRSEFLASPIGTVPERNAERLADKAAQTAAEYGAGEIIVGLPINMNGTEGPRAEKCRAFAELLKERTDLPVRMWDERSTTVTAHNILNETNVRGKARKAVVDTVAATIILEGYLEYRRKKAKQKRNIIIVIIVLAVMVLADFVWSNTYIEVKKLSAHFDNLPEGFEGCKIVQISDFHNEWGKGYIDRLTEKVKDCEPDYIFVTGDSVDQIFPDVDRSLELMKKLPDICPVYLVMGNHEYNLSQEEREQFVSGCESYGVNVLYNEHTTLTRNGDTISLLGFDNMENDSKAFSQVTEDFVILLNHYPEDCNYFSKTAVQYGTHIDIDFTGHAHGGLIRLPFVNGLYAPGQGLFPKYTDGTYSVNDTTLVVSRGVGNSGWTQRFSDPFELVLFTIEK